MNTMNLVAGLDIGNGYVKGAVNLKENLKNKPKSIDFPSGVARIIYPKDIKTEVSEAGYVIDDIFNQMDVSFGSNLVKDTTRRLFGARGLASGSTLEEFDVDSVQSKAQQDLSGILVLGCIAGQALKEYSISIIAKSPSLKKHFFKSEFYCDYTFILITENSVEVRSNDAVFKKEILRKIDDSTF